MCFGSLCARISNNRTNVSHYARSYCHFPSLPLAPSHSLATHSAASTLLALIVHGKLTGFELKPFVKSHRSGIMGSPASAVAGRMSNAHSILEIVMKSELRARCIPIQIRRPKPNGRSKSCRRGLVVSRNRSGRSSSGDGNIPGSCMIPLQRDRHLVSSLARTRPHGI